jgi:ArsR family transcriptional regulator
MDKLKAVDAFAALSQDTRLSALLVLVEYGHTGLPAGDLADRLAVPHNTLSFHLSQLERAGLVTSRRNGRKVIYFASIDALQSLGQFLLTNCCIRESAESPLCAPSTEEVLASKDNGQR